jgi:hypothetical protein
METIENKIDAIKNKVAELLTGSSFDKFSYSGIYTMTFTLKQPFYGFDYCNIDIGTAIKIEKENITSAPKIFSIEDFFSIWSKSITKVELKEDLSLLLFFEDSFSCKINSYLEDQEGLFDMRWTLYQNKKDGSFSVWVSNEENIYLQMP